MAHPQNHRRDPDLLSKISSRTVSNHGSDENIVHSSYEAGVLEDPSMTPPKVSIVLCVSSIS